MKHPFYIVVIFIVHPFYRLSLGHSYCKYWNG